MVVIQENQANCMLPVQECQARPIDGAGLGLCPDESVAPGNTPPNAPLHSGSLWSVYTFQSGLLEGFGFGGGLSAAGRRQGDIDNTFQIPGFVRLDAALYYRKQEIFPRTNLIASLNFRNLLDQRYFEGTQESRTSVIPGAPLTVIGAIKLEFYQKPSCKKITQKWSCFPALVRL
jgi:outer membrane receptor protein involved in Fe transport